LNPFLRSERQCGFGAAGNHAAQRIANRLLMTVIYGTQH
jgi:hypothetical protein